MNIKEKKELISKMKDQHKELQECVDFIFEQLSELKGPSSMEIFEKLTKFKTDLDEHLELENETFYPVLLEDMKSKGENTMAIEGFINEMRNIEAEVRSFLGNYGSANEIEVDLHGFEDEFSRIRRTYMLRVETEEAGVFTYWDEEK